MKEQSSLVEKRGRLSLEKYKERVKVIRYSVTFAGGAAAFLVTAKTELALEIEAHLLKYSLLFWGATIFTGFLQYILSYREVWYDQRLPRGALRKKLFFPVELALLYAVLALHPILMICSIVFTVFTLWRAFPA